MHRESFFDIIFYISGNEEKEFLLVYCADEVLTHHKVDGKQFQSSIFFW